MRCAIPLALCLAGCAPTGPGGGIVSTNPCADAILVRLVAPARIAAISNYSHDPAATSLPLDVARRFRATGGTAEEVIALHPALVITSSLTPSTTRDAYARAGLKTLVLDSPTTVAGSIAQVRRIAAAVGAKPRGEAMVAGIARALTPPPAATRSALLFIGGDLANGGGTLLDELMRRAGFRNAAADYGLAFTGTLPVERIATHPPDVVIASREGRSAALRRRVLPGVREATFDRRLVNCGGPVIPPALARLRAIRATL